MNFCTTCGFEIGENKECSGFCLEATPSEISKFRQLKVGDYGPFPCSRCGNLLEGEFSPVETCSTCAGILRVEDLQLKLQWSMAAVRESKKLLAEVRDGVKINRALATKIDGLLGKL